MGGGSFLIFMQVRLRYWETIKLLSPVELASDQRELLFKLQVEPLSGKLGLGCSAEGLAQCKRGFEQTHTNHLLEIDMKQLR